MNIPERLEVTEDGALLRITWAGGRRSDLPAAALRSACPCASCGEPVGRSNLQRTLAASTPVTIAGAALVGSYALGVTFAPDGHRTGIFPFDLLASLGEAYDGSNAPGGSTP
jgi:DUF971 family protein